MASGDENAHEVRLTSHGELLCGPLEIPKLAPEETFTWWVYQHQQPLIIPYVDAETRFPAVTEMLKDREVQSVTPSQPEIEAFVYIDGSAAG